MQPSEPRRFEFNPAKFEELFILLAVGQQDHPMPDFTKLNKAMYLVDFAAFRQEGEPFTGADYLHYEEGPVPAQVTGCINQLALNNDIICRHKYHVLGDFRHPCVPERFAKTELLPRPLYQMGPPGPGAPQTPHAGRGHRPFQTRPWLVPHLARREDPVRDRRRQFPLIPGFSSRNPGPKNSTGSPEIPRSHT